MQSAALSSQVIPLTAVSHPHPFALLPQVTLAGFLPCAVVSASPRRLACTAPAVLGAMKAEWWRTPWGSASWVNLDAYGEPGRWL